MEKFQPSEPNPASLATSSAVSCDCALYGSPSAIVRSGTLCAVKMTGTLLPVTRDLFVHPAVNFSPRARASNGLSCHDSTKSSVNDKPESPTTAERYRTTEVREFCGARQIDTTRARPSDAICLTTSAMYGFQLRIPT